MKRSRIVRGALVAAMVASVMVLDAEVFNVSAERSTQAELASDSGWTVVGPNATAARPSGDAEPGVRPAAFTAATLDESVLAARLATAGRGGPGRVIQIPDPSGQLVSFEVNEAETLSPEVAAEHPELKAYVGTALDGSGAPVRFELTPYGFSAQVSAADGWWYVDPAYRFEPGDYVSYYKSDLPNEHDWFERRLSADLAERAAVARAAAEGVGDGDEPVQAKSNGTQTRTYRLAVSADDQYVAANGGTANSALAVIVQAVNRVNGIYGPEAAIQFTLVSNTNTIFPNDATDPFNTPNNNTILNINQTQLDAIIGDANYDVGHHFNTSCGLAAAGVGVTGVKAQGCSGVGVGGDPYVVDYVAHEIGHQFSANHTFNGNRVNCAGGTRNGPTAYEPGSATTILGYAGICGLDDVQFNNATGATGSYAVGPLRVPPAQLTRLPLNV